MGKTFKLIEDGTYYCEDCMESLVKDYGYSYNDFKEVSSIIVECENCLEYIN